MRHPSLDADRLGSLRPALEVELLEQASSTNAVAADRARAGAPEGLVVVAESQTSGRGRLDRSWHTPPRAALLFSIILRPTVPAFEWPWLPLLTGHTVAKALRGAGYGAGVKWPNDVLIGDRKLVGILVERVETPTGPAAVVGVGINVSVTRDELPVATATSLAIEAGRDVDRTEVLVDVLSALIEAYDAWQAGGPQARDRLATSYAEACVTVGRDVRVELPAAEPLLGRATGVDRTGRLVVAGPDGPVAVGAGDVVHVRAAPQAPDR